MEQMMKEREGRRGQYWKGLHPLHCCHVGPSLDTSFNFPILSAMASMALSKEERDVVVECRGHDAARFCNVDHAHGWEKDVVGMVEQEHGKSKILVSFECETLKAEKEAEEHIMKFMPKLAGMDAVVNVGRMRIEGLEFEVGGGNERVHESM
ncbi:hypothetical protein RHGRI_028505 [Rhododendron griersonianum]|uniref:Uncharacterized protein n=1 Tax=Rhododendron griersonianum TaxID=479676 RepID=A0AAV6IJC8_9ERIC|nr:hypothetical protein RHGRI_028505 [Rhododendron griersonianum]